MYALRRTVMGGVEWEKEELLGSLEVNVDMLHAKNGGIHVER